MGGDGGGGGDTHIALLMNRKPVSKSCFHIHSPSGVVFWGVGVGMWDFSAAVSDELVKRDDSRKGLTPRLRL